MPIRPFRSDPTGICSNCRIDLVSRAYSKNLSITLTFGGAECNTGDDSLLSGDP